MPPTNTLFGKAGSVKRLAAICIAMLFAAQAVSLIVGRAQSIPQAEGKAGGRVLLQTSSGSIVTASAEPPGPQAEAALRSLLRKHPGTWKVELEQGAVKRLRPVTDVSVGASPRAFSAELMSELSSLFGVSPEETSYFADYPLRERLVVEYRQELTGIPVEHSFVTISTVGGKLEQISTRLYQRVGQSLTGVTPSLTQQEAAAAAADDLRREYAGAAALQLSSESSLIILPEGESFFLTWKVVVTAQGALLSYTYYVDAATGRIVKKYSNVQSQKQGSPQQQNAETRQVTSATLKRKLDASAPAAEGEGEGKANTGTEAAAPALQLAGVWEHVLSENFDVREFPYAPWRAFDNNGATGGELFWDDQNCISNDPSWSLWAADGGANRLNACTDNYAHNMNSWVVYGPFSLSNAADGLLDFHYRNDSEANFDYFQWMVSVDGTNFHGFQVSGSSGGWQYASLDFKNVPTLGNILGRPSVWIAFIFTSDSSVISGKGAFVDDVAIKRLNNNTCAGISGHIGGHVYGRNRNELQLSNFKNMKVVLDRSLASDSHAVTDASGNYSSSECSDRVRFELEGFGSRNFLKVKDCNNGGCFLGGGDILRSPDFNFASAVNFDWNEADDNKKEVNVFWHVNEMHDWFRNLIGQDLMNYQMQAHVDYVDNFSCGVGTINAFYNRDNDNIYFCPSDVSRESDIIYHEYTHGLVDHIANYDPPYEDEGGALNEGVADYFAAARNGDPTIGEGVGVIRRITDVVNYSDRCSPETSVCRDNQYHTRATAPSNGNDFGFVHHNSLVPSGALWNLRHSQGLSPGSVDKLVIDTLILQRPLTIQQLLDGLIAQDGGGRESQIRAAFATRGVGQASITIGQGAPNPQLFIDAANRNNLSQFVHMPPVNAVHRWDCFSCNAANPAWGKGLIQDFNGNDGVTHHALMRADANPNFVALVYGGMWSKFISLGGLNHNAANNRTLGYPIADRNCSDFNGQCFTDAQLVSPFGTSYHYQRFQGAALVLHKSGPRINQTYEVHGAIRTRWQDGGGPGGGAMGLPVSDEYAWQGKRRSDFEGGSICYNPTNNQTEIGCVTQTTTVQVTVQTNPSGRPFTVDGTTYTSAQVFTWNSGSSHTISTTSPQVWLGETRYVWTGWSDGGAISHTVAPTSNTTYTANFTTQYFLTMHVGRGGTISPASGWYNRGQIVSLSAVPASGFLFGGWSGAGVGSYTGMNNPASVTMNGPIVESGSFLQPNNFSISASPPSRTVGAGGSTTFAVSTATTAGVAQTVSLSVSGLPAGATRSFSQSSVITGGSSTLTVTTSSSTPEGSYPLTITGAGSVSRSTGVTLNVTRGGVNVALAANGGVATASSTFDAGRSPAGAINGDRRGLNWGSGGGWGDATSGLYPDWLQVTFNGSKTINEINVYTLQNNYVGPAEPTDTMTFSAYGITAFSVQYWTGAAWATVPGGSVTGNNLVRRSFTFPAITTSRIRVLVNNSLASYSRIVEVEAYTPKTNVALAANGATASASSTFDAGRSPAGAINGDRRGLNWGSGGGWGDATSGLYPDWLQVTFNGSKTIREVQVFTLQNNYVGPAEPTDTTLFSLYGVTAFSVQYWTGAAWATVPGGSVTGNNRVKRTFLFPPITTSRVRVLVTNSLAGYSRLTEVEVY